MFKIKLIRKIIFDFLLIALPNILLLSVVIPILIKLNLNININVIKLLEGIAEALPWIIITSPMLFFCIYIFSIFLGLLFYLPIKFPLIGKIILPCVIIYTFIGIYFLIKDEIALLGIIIPDIIFLSIEGALFFGKDNFDTEWDCTPIDSHLEITLNTDSTGRIDKVNDYADDIPFATNGLFILGYTLLFCIGGTVVFTIKTFKLIKKAKMLN